MSQRLNGINPLSYLGVNPYTPAAQQVSRTRSPTQNDSVGFYIGDEWTVTVTPYSVWKLVNLNAGIATWVQIYPAGGGAGGFSTQAPGRAGGAGGDGGIGFFSGPTSGGATIAYSLGAGGNIGTTSPGGNDGNAGSASTLGTFTANGGGGGVRGGPAFQPNRATKGTYGTAPGGILLPEKTFFAGSAGLGPGTNFSGDNAGGPNPVPGAVGGGGGVVYFDDGNA